MTNGIITKELSMPKLFFQDIKTGERYEISSVKEIELTCNDEHTINEYTNLWNYTDTFECNINVKRSSVNEIMIAIGLKNCIANNWLKMHKYPMNRKRG